MTKTKLLFVCMGNICRSPTAHAVMRDKIVSQGLEAEISIDSAGTHAHHIGEAPDSRAQQTAAARGIDTRGLSARKIHTSDYQQFDFIYAMDQHNLDLIQHHQPEVGASAHVLLFLDSAVRLGLTKQKEVPDPYYGGSKGFDNVFDLVDLGCDAILKELLNR